MSLHKNHHHNLINYILVITMACLLGFQVYISNRIATSGKIISQLEQRSIELEDSNRKLLSDNVEEFSLTTLAQKAKELGFVEPQAVLHMGDSSRLAMN